MKSKIIKLGVSAVIIAGIILPVLIFAETETKNGNQITAKFCEKISAFSQTIDQRINSRNSKLDEKRTNISDKIAANREDRDSRFEEIIQKWDKNREEHFAKMLEKAQDDQQKQAIVAFKEAVQTAILNRRTAIKNAIKSFREGVDAVVLLRKRAVDEAANVYKTAIAAALTKAQDDCKNGIAPATVRNNLLKDLKEAKDKFIADKQSIKKIEDNMQFYIDARKEAIEKANTDFQAAIQKAKDDFKIAMEQTVGEKNNIEKACTDSGGTIEKSSCCTSSGDFPNLCLIGACGCSAENSHEVKVCNCGEGKCFNGTSCVAVQ